MGREGEGEYSVQTWKQSDCSGTWWHFNSLWLRHSMEYCTSVKKKKQNKLDLYIPTWKDFQDVLLDEKLPRKKVCKKCKPK